MEPMAWVGTFMCWLTDALGTIMTLTGLAGLLLLMGHGLVRATEYIIDKEDMTHDDNRQE